QIREMQFHYEEQENKLKEEIQLARVRFESSIARAEQSTKEERDKLVANSKKQQEDKEKALSTLEEKKAVELAQLRSDFDAKEARYVSEIRDVFETRMRERMMHESSMSSAYGFISGVPMLAAADKESQILEVQKARICETLMEINKRMDSLREQFLDREHDDFYSKEDELRRMTKSCEDMRDLCTTLLNTLEQSANINNEIRKAAADSLFSINAGSTSIHNQIIDLRQLMIESPQSVTFNDLREIRYSLMKLQSDCDRMPAIQGKSLSKRVQDHIGHMSRTNEDVIASIGSAPPADE
ncbi:hypothetical protein PFISCL1PPCAC_7339, partial [Pristionchus fissidentatus]